MLNSRESCPVHIESYSISLHGGRCSLDSSTLEFNFENNLRYSISTSTVFRKYPGLSKKLLKFHEAGIKIFFFFIEETSLNPL